ncbi:uncharacterized protein HKW66_Vig0144760 [Vigna angularis]|uniref:Ubiquitin-like protease family profile domain-containing protein n=1 Tax=Phaseolus angularis TaxID=3914 RepID=A0A8T0KCY8_PHAAN|nr:uncharacterized protein HKW66_Vig0144760 [Vigna angularis]
MSASDSGSGKSRRGRGVTRVADVTSGRVDGQRRHVDIDPRSGHPSGPNADRFRSYLGKLAKSHVSILHACWDDVPEVDKNLLWQDVLQHFDIPNTLQIRKKVLSHIAIRFKDFKTRLTRLYVFGDRQHENPSQHYTFTEEDWMQFRASRETEEWKHKRLAAQERQRLNDTPHLLSRGGYAKLEKKLRKSRADALGLESPDLAPAPASQETLRQMDLQWEERLNQSMRSMEQRFMEQLQEQKQIQRALEEKLHSMTQGHMGADETPTAPRVSTRGSCSAVEPNEYSGQYELLFTRPQKQPIHDTVIHEDDDMAEAEDDPISKLVTKLPRLKKASLQLYWDLRVFGLPPHVPVYITFSDALEVIEGDRMLNISIIQLWCMYMDTIVVDQGRSSMYGFVEPQTIQPSGNTLQNRQHYLQTWMDESKRDIYLVPYIDGSHWQLMVIIPKQCKIIWFCSLHRKMKNDLRTMLQGVIGKSRGQLVQILYPKVVDSWECGFYVMCWIKTIIRAVITDDWNERFKTTSPIAEDTINQIRQEWTAYLLQRWS